MAMAPMEERRLAARLLAAWLVTTLLLTLAPFGPLRAPRSWSASSRLDTFDFFVNIVLYLPLGFFAAKLGYRRALAVAAGALLSLAIESAQMVIPLRHPSQLDLVANVAGTALGLLASGPAWRVLGAFLRPPETS